jgi:hypothetical protein
MALYLVNWDPSDFGPWHLQDPPITEEQSRNIGARLPTEWSPSFHQRIEVAIKNFVDDTIGASSPPNSAIAAMKELHEDPDRLSAILRLQPSDSPEDFGRLLVRDYFQRSAPARTEKDSDLAWAVDVVLWMRAEIGKIANAPRPKGRRSKLHLDNFLFAVTEISLSCGVRKTLPGHDGPANASNHPLYAFAREMLFYGCSYGMQVAKNLPTRRRLKTEETLQAVSKSTPRALIDSLERAKRQYQPQDA